MAFNTRDAMATAYPAARVRRAGQFNASGPMVRFISWDSYRYPLDVIQPTPARHSVIELVGV